MEILPKPRLIDWLHYLAANALCFLSGVTAFSALRQWRVLTMIWMGLKEYGTPQRRVVNQFSWIIFWLAFAVYMLSVIPLYNGAVTQARVRRAQGRHISAAEAAHPWMRWLVDQDADVLAKRFSLIFPIPVVALLLALLLGRIIAGG